MTTLRISKMSTFSMKETLKSGLFLMAGCSPNHMTWSFRRYWLKSMMKPFIFDK